MSEGVTGFQIVKIFIASCVLGFFPDGLEGIPVVFMLFTMCIWLTNIVNSKVGATK